MAKSTFTTVKDLRVGSIQNDAVNIAKFIDVKNSVKFSELLPFRVRFTTIGLGAYGPGNAAPIGIAIIGLNNYVM